MQAASQAIHAAAERVQAATSQVVHGTGQAVHSVVQGCRHRLGHGGGGGGSGLPPSLGSFMLDEYDRHLDLDIDQEKLVYSCMHERGFQYLWKGARATKGVRRGKFMYEVKVLENLPARMPDTPPGQQSLCRVGFSLPLSPLYLGETSESWAFDGAGKKCHNGHFEEYDGAFGPGDVVGCIVDVDQRTIQFTKDGRPLGVAFTDLPPATSERGVFPHVMLKNVRAQLNFSRERKWCDAPGDVRFFEEAEEDARVPNPVEHPHSHAECEFVMLVGLPGAGKTTWAEAEMAGNPTKNFLHMGTNVVIDQMRVVGVSRKNNYAGRWNELFSQAQPIFNQLKELASHERGTPRNVILDQTNVYAAARARKAAPFMKSFGRKRCVVFVNDDAEQERRRQQMEESGMFVPYEVDVEMAAHFALPDASEGWDEITFVGLPEEEARKQVAAVRQKARELRESGQVGGPGGSKPRIERRDEPGLGSGIGHPSARPGSPKVMDAKMWGEWPADEL